jgi:DeoR/GlpR family transcriptional regulator of sugar metabolism
MLTEQRKQFLLERLKRDGRIVAKDLSAELALSEDTIRRDLRELAAAGLLQRVHGGALPSSPTVAGLPVRRTMAVEEKQRLGRTGARLVERGQTIFIDGGTTNLELVRALPLDLVATIVTHSPAIAAALEPFEAATVIMIGGTLFRHSMVTVGAAALDQICRISVDLFYLGVTGVHASEGLTTGDYEEAGLKRAIMARSAECCALVTSEKLGAVSPFQIAPLQDLTTLIVSEPAELPWVEEAGISLIRA